MTNYEEYLAALKTDYTPITRIDFLYPDGSVAYRLDSDVLQDGSSVNVAQQVTGARRTGTLVLDNWKQIYNLHPDQIWFGQQIKVSKGLEFKVRKRATPTVTLYTYGGTSGQWDLGGATSDCSVGTYENGFALMNNTGRTVTPTAGEAYGHWTADAEL